MRHAEGHGGSASIAVPEYWWYVARADLLKTALAEYAAQARLALDLGSADAPSASWLREMVDRTVALDIDPRGLEERGVCGSALALPFEDGAFDLVSAFDVIEHLAPEQDALGEVARVLRPGGRFLMSVPAYQWAWTDFDVACGHHRRYTRPRAVAALERAGFRVDRATYGFASVFPLFVVERLTRRVLHSKGNRRPADIVSVPSLPRAAHHALIALCRIDQSVLGRGDLPFGSSVLVAAAKPS